MRWTWLMGALLWMEVSPQNAAAASNDQEDARQTAEEPSGEGQPTITLIGGTDELVARYGLDAVLQLDTPFCLEEGEQAIFASDRFVFEGSGPACFNLRDEERPRYEVSASAIVMQDGAGAVSEEGALDTDLPDANEGEPPLSPSRTVTIVGGSEELVSRYGLDAPVSFDQPFCLLEGETVVFAFDDKTVEFEGPRCIDSEMEIWVAWFRGADNDPTFYVDVPETPGHARPIMIPGTPGYRPRATPANRTRPIVFRVSGGSATVLRRYKRGSLVLRNTAI